MRNTVSASKFSVISSAKTPKKKPIYSSSTSIKTSKSYSPMPTTDSEKSSTKATTTTSKVTGRLPCSFSTRPVTSVLMTNPPKVYSISSDSISTKLRVTGKAIEYSSRNESL